jgi:glycosyltransferase involved in cell wall biosynthesis
LVHLIVSREFPPAPYPPGGIGTYVASIARLLAGSGETVHVIAQRWDGARDPVEKSLDGRLVVHRVSLTDPIVQETGERERLRDLAHSDCPYQVFSWQAARLAELLVDREGIDVIEAQEWEAPLYHFQRRRAEGFGSRRQPPCVITLHSPTEFIVRHNEWDPTFADFRSLARAEAYSIRAADGLICPSQYLAEQAARHFDVPLASISVIPYPVAEPEAVERHADVWTRNRVAYVGRLELRKGIVELVHAAVEVAREFPTVSFDLLGADTSRSGGPGPTVLPMLRQMIPGDLRDRFRFHGSLPRARVRQILEGASAVIVPARWENLPYSCLEAMAGGLPVIASPAGGMREVVVDGEAGWIAPDSTASGLAFALRRMLTTPGPERARMGQRAADAIRLTCGGSAIVARHLETRRRLVSRPPRAPLADGGGAIELATAAGGPPPRLSSGAIALGRFQMPFLRWLVRAPLPVKWSAVRRAASQPGSVFRWATWTARRRFERFAGRGTAGYLAEAESLRRPANRQ